MKAMLRLGSAWHDVATQVKAITELGLDSRHFILVTDDSHSGTLVGEGHIDRVLRHAISQGLKPITAIQMATLNTAEHFGVAHDVGQIAPGRFADVLIASDLPSMAIDTVIASGRVLAEAGKLVVDLPHYEYPAEARDSVRLGKRLEAGDFVTRTDANPTVIANVIGVIENQAPTRHLRLTLPVKDGVVQNDPAQDVSKVALVERHQATGGVQIGFVHGFGLKGRCAAASTVAHDSHHMLVVGTDDGAMAQAANELARVGGGQVVVKDDQVTGLVELPVGGLMSDERAEVVAAKAEGVLEALRQCGCNMHNANMQLSLLALVVIPELRISDLGLVDVTKFEFLPVLED
jgi:adenine deaminase